MKLVPIDRIEGPFANACFIAMQRISIKLDRMKDENGDVNENSYILGFASLVGEIIGNTKYILGGENEKIIASASTAVQELITRLRRYCHRHSSPNVVVKPDYIIHWEVKKGNMSEETQKLIVEAKTTKSLHHDNFCWDLYKLSSYVYELSFQTAVYIIINQKVSKVEELLKVYCDKELPVIKVQRGKLLFFIQEDISSDPKAYVLDCDN